MYTSFETFLDNSLNEAQSPLLSLISETDAKYMKALDVNSFHRQADGFKGEFNNNLKSRDASDISTLNSLLYPLAQYCGILRGINDALTTVKYWQLSFDEKDNGGYNGDLYPVETIEDVYKGIIRHLANNAEDMKRLSEAGKNDYYEKIYYSFAQSTLLNMLHAAKQNLKV